jgi:PAS domain S-box-containing protein
MAAVAKGPMPMEPKQDALLAAVMRASLDCIVVIDEAGIVVDWNAAAERTFGYSRELALGEPVANLIIPEDRRAVFYSDMRRYLEGGEPRFLNRRVEVEANHANGSPVPVEMAITEAEIDGRRLFMASLRDLTDRLETQSRLRDSEARLKALLDHAPMTMYLKDREGHYCIANRFMADQVGMTPEQLRTLTPQDILSPASAAEAAAVDQIIVDTGEPDIRESEFQTVQGMKSAVTVRFPVFNDRGEIAYIGGVFLDTSEQRRAQRRFRALSEHHPVAMLIARAEDHRILLANPAFFKLIGLPQDSDVSMVSQFRWLDDPDEDRRFRELLREHERFDNYECRMRRVDGAFWASISWRHIDFDGERSLVFSALNIADKKNAETELERSREALHQSEKMNALGSLLAGVSHELNNPLAIVVGEAILLEEEAEGTPLAGSAARIKRAAERCSRIVQTFLAMARQKTPERKACPVNELIEGTLELADYGLRSNGIDVVQRLAPDLPPLWADPDQVSQVLLNLLINAQQALQGMTGPRCLTIESRLADHGQVAILVSDNGPGVPSEVLRRIFEPFFTTKPQGSGTGIGLSFSLGIAEAHGGTLRLVPSEVGAAFELLLPSAPETKAQPEPAQDVQVSTAGDRGKRALVVDDEPDLAQTLAGLLQGEGFEVAVAVGGAAAIEQLRDSEFDVVLSDLRMPGVDGPALYAWVRSERPQMAGRIGFVTGDTLGPAAVHFLKEAGRPHIEKPFSRQAIRELVGELTRGC